MVSSLQPLVPWLLSGQLAPWSWHQTSSRDSLHVYVGSFFHGFHFWLLLLPFSCDEVHHFSSCLTKVRQKWISEYLRSKNACQSPYLTYSGGHRSLCWKPPPSEAGRYYSSLWVPGLIAENSGFTWTVVTLSVSLHVDLESPHCWSALQFHDGPPLAVLIPYTEHNIKHI